MSIKTKFIYPLVGILMLLSACTPTSSSGEPASSEPESSESPVTSETSEKTEKPDPEAPGYYNELNKRVKYDLNNEFNFVDDIKGGLNDDVWYALDGSWHTEDVGAPHNGVRRRNLFYTKDTNNEQYLAIKGRGFYNAEDTSNKYLPEGGVILTKNHLSPGRYEIKMAAHPREGAVTAMWTYCTTTGNEATSQNEIDIEIGGKTGANQFEHLWSSSWVKHTTKETKTPKVSDQLFLNDGKIHKYTFDWYTNYMGTGTKRVDWFIDEVYITSIEGNVVPEHNMPLWVGVWFPPRWAGNPAFISDYLLVKEISFQAFDHTQWYDNCRTQPGYTKVTIADAGIQTIPFATVKNINKLSNSSFESLEKSARDNSYFGWEVDNASKGTVSLSNESTVGNNSFKLTASGETTSRYNGQYLKQTLSNAFPGYTYDFSLDAKLVDNNSVGNIEIIFRNDTNQKVTEIIIPIETTIFTTYSRTLTVPVGAKKIEINITAETNSVLYDNANLIFIDAN